MGITTGAHTVEGTMLMPNSATIHTHIHAHNTHIVHIASLPTSQSSNEAVAMYRLYNEDEGLSNIHDRGFLLVHPKPSNVINPPKWRSRERRRTVCRF